MRHLVLAAILAAPLTAFAADEGGAFGELMVRKPVNTVCPFDGHPVEASLPPVGMVGADGQEVLVGADSQACVNRLHSTFGDEGRKVAAAAKANTTVDKLPAGGTLPPPPAPASPSSFGPPASTTGSGFGGQSTGPKPAFGNPPSTSSSFGPASTASGPAVVNAAPVATTGAGSRKSEKSERKSEKSSKPKHEHEDADASLRGDQSDERQRQKKAAQRRDRGVSDEGEPTTKHHSSSSKKKSSKAEEPAPAAEPSTGGLDTGAPVLGQ